MMNHTFLGNSRRGMKRDRYRNYFRALQLTATKTNTILNCAVCCAVLSFIRVDYFLNPHLNCKKSGQQIIKIFKMHPF